MRMLYQAVELATRKNDDYELFRTYDAGDKEAAIKGSSGTVKDGIMPGYFGYEAGQSCVGDHFAWFAENCVPKAMSRRRV